jgi:predicted acetyltransferase
MLDYNKISLMPAAAADYAVIQNMARFYVYDMSEYLGQEPGWEMPEDGLYECIDFSKYWHTKHAWPYLICYGKELAGFVIVDTDGSGIAPLADYNMAQFFIARKFKGKGLGRFVASECFDKFPGIWDVLVIPGNAGAYHFWKKTISSYTNNKFSESKMPIPSKGNEMRIVFRFSSSKD